MLLVASVLVLAGSAGSTNTFQQRGTVEAPRAIRYDGQPLATSTRLEVHGGTTPVSALEARDGGRSTTTSNAAAVTRHDVGASARFRVGPNADLGVEVDGAWSPTSVRVDGVPVAAPGGPVVSTIGTLRASVPLNERVRLGVGFDLGGTSVPIHRLHETVGESELRSPPATSRDWALVARAALVPSYQRGALTLFGSVGLSTETEVPPLVVWNSLDGDPGVQAGVAGPAITVAAGATLETAPGVRLTARIADAYSERVATDHYGPQVDVGLAFDVGR